MLRNKDTVLMIYHLICNLVLTLSFKTVTLSTVHKPIKCWHPKIYIVHESTLQDIHINILVVIIVDSEKPLFKVVSLNFVTLPISLHSTRITVPTKGHG